MGVISIVFMGSINQLITGGAPPCNSSDARVHGVDIYRTSLTGAFHAGNGWEWGLLGSLIVMKWIIPSFPTFNLAPVVNGGYKPAN